MIRNKRGAVAALIAATALVQNVSAEPRPGMGSVGGEVGVPYIVADSELRESQSPRLLGQIHFQYVMSPGWRLSTKLGYGWVGYSDGVPTPYPLLDPDTGDSVRVRDDMLTKFQPLTVTLVRALSPQGRGWSPFVGAGVNLHRVEIVNKRRKIADPATFDDYVHWSPGVHAVGGAEYFIPANDNVSLVGSARWAYLLRKDESRFPSGFSGPHSLVNINFGVNVYFWPIGQKPIETAPAPEPAGGPPDESGSEGDEAGGDPDDSPQSLRTGDEAPRVAGAWRGSVLSQRPAPARPAAAPPPDACPSYDLGPMLGVPPGAAREEGLLRP